VISTSPLNVETLSLKGQVVEARKSHRRSLRLRVIVQLMMMKKMKERVMIQRKRLMGIWSWTIIWGQA